jgi:hypothetical protein
MFKEFLSFFKRFVPIGISQINCHLLILDGRGSHVTLEAIEKAHEFGNLGHLAFLYLPHTLAFKCFLLQTLQDFIYKKKGVAVVRSRFSEHDKITLARWVDKALNQSLTKQKVKVGFKGT